MQRNAKLHALPVIALAASFGVACHEQRACEARVGNVCAVAGTGEWGFNGDKLRATETDLFLVSAARRGPDERIWIMDFNNMRLRVIEDDGRMQTMIGNGFHALAEAEASALDSPLENPIDFGFLSDGRPVFVSYHDPRVIALGDDDVLRVVAGSGELGMIGDEGDGGPALSAMFMELNGIAIDRHDAIYVSDSLANRVRLVKDGIVTTVAGTGESGYAGDGGPGTAAALSWPSALELDDAGNLYIADTLNHVVRKLGVDGTITTVAGVGTRGVAGDGGLATAAQLNQPFGLALGDDGMFYVADRGNFKVRRVAPDGVIETLAGTGRQGWSGDDGPAARAQFGYLARISLDGDALLVVDQSSSQVRRVNLP